MLPPQKPSMPAQALTFQWPTHISSGNQPPATPKSHGVGRGSLKLPAPKVGAWPKRGPCPLATVLRACNPERPGFNQLEKMGGDVFFPVAGLRVCTPRAAPQHGHHAGRTCLRRGPSQREAKTKLGESSSVQPLKTLHLVSDPGLPLVAQASKSLSAWGLQLSAPEGSWLPGRGPRPSEQGCFASTARNGLTADENL